MSADKPKAPASSSTDGRPAFGPSQIRCSRRPPMSTISPRIFTGLATNASQGLQNPLDHLLGVELYSELFLGL